MYTAEPNTDQAYGDKHTDWCIMDPDGDWITNVPTEHSARALLSHLNR